MPSFTYGLYNKLEARNSKVRAVCAHPGGSDTNLGHYLNIGWHWNLTMKVITPIMLQSSEDGAAGMVCVVDQIRTRVQAL